MPDNSDLYCGLYNTLSTIVYPLMPNYRPYLLGRLLPEDTVLVKVSATYYRSFALNFMRLAIG